MKKCAFTGHRPQRLPFGADEADERCIRLKQVLREQIIRLIEEDGVSYFITGMAMGIDMYAAEIVLDLKARYPALLLECAIPYEEQAMRWTNALRERYYDIASKCDKETMLQTRYSADCFQRRNRYMVDQADIVLAVWNGQPSGTGSTVRYAMERGKQIYRIDPEFLI